MTLSKTISTVSLALALLAGAFVAATDVLSHSDSPATFAKFKSQTKPTGRVG